MAFHTANDADLKEGVDHCEGAKATNSDDLHQAQRAAEERDTTFLKSIKQHRAAVAWSVLLSTAIIMEGYDMKLIGSLNAQPAFTKRCGKQLANGKYEIPAAWQAGLSNGASVGSIIGLYLNGHMSERLGFEKAMLLSLVVMTLAIFIPFFAPSIQVLLVGQIFQGIPWAEVCPVHLRGYLTTYVNLCWVIGQFLSAGVLRAMATRSDQWAYRIPFTIQWIWPVPLIIAISFAPESPWWCVHKDRIDGAKANLHRLVDSRTTSAEALDNMVKLMEVTVAQEREAGTGKHYPDCFRGVNRRRTIIACCTWGIQILSGTGLRTYATYPICYALVSEVPASELRSKTVVLARMSYNMLNIVSNVITPYMLNPGAWAWGAKTGFFFAGTCFLSLIFTLLCIPETKNRTYAELNILFQRRIKAWKFAKEKVTLDAEN